MQKEIWVADRIENGIAVCIADGTMAVRHLSLARYPHINEGDVLQVTIDAASVVQVVPLPEKTKKRRQEAQQRLRALFEKHKNNG